MTAAHIDQLLLIEDNDGDARLFQEMLNEREANTTILTRVATMREAEAYLAEHAVDIVLLDLGLPDVQGLEALRRTRAAAPGIPTVVLTGMDDEGVARLALQQGAQDFLIKGEIEIRGLMRALRYAIEREAMEETARGQGLQLRQMQSELVFMSQQSAMGTMAATLAHELNQPLTAISNYTAGLAKMLETYDLPPAFHAGFKMVQETALRAGEIIRRMRSMALEGRVKREDVNLVEAFANAATFVRAGCGKIEFAYSFHHEKPIKADRVQIEQVLGNLIRNACEAMEHSDRRVVTISTSDQADGLLVEVADTGPGIPTGVLLFEATLSTKAQGMGLGLSICRTIVEAHGGRIWAAPSQGGGTAISFTLPSEEILTSVQRDAA